MGKLIQLIKKLTDTKAKYIIMLRTTYFKEIKCSTDMYHYLS